MTLETKLNGNAKIVTANDGTKELYVPHLGKTLVFQLEPKRSDAFYPDWEKLIKIGKRAPTISQHFSLFNILAQNKDNQVCSDIFKKAQDNNYCFFTTTWRDTDYDKNNYVFDDFDREIAVGNDCCCLYNKNIWDLYKKNDPRIRSSKEISGLGAEFLRLLNHEINNEPVLKVILGDSRQIPVLKNVCSLIYEGQGYFGITSPYERNTRGCYQLYLNSCGFQMLSDSKYPHKENYIYIINRVIEPTFLDKIKGKLFGR